MSAAWDDIDWGKYSHINGLVDEIADALHAYRSSSYSIHRNARTILFFRNSRYALPYFGAETIPLIIAHTIQLLRDPTFAYRGTLLGEYTDILRQTTHARYGNRVSLTIAEMEQAGRLFRVFDRHASILIAVMDDPDPVVRKRLLTLLPFLHDFAHRFIQPLIDMHYHEPRPEIQLEVLKALQRITRRHLNMLRPRMPRPAWLPALQWYAGLVANDDDSTLQDRGYAAWLWLVCERDYLPPEIMIELEEWLLSNIDDYDLLMNIMDDLSHLPPGQLSTLINHPRIAPHHSLHLLHLYLNTRNLNRMLIIFGTVDGRGNKVDHIVSQNHDSVLEDLAPLKLIAHCDAYWQEPRNLLSTIWKMPDDRASLLKYLESMEPAY